MTDTPTPPAMTPEQRAVLVAELRLPWFTNGCEWYQVRAANSLEADGVTITTLTAERDAARAEIARLTAALATARADGMREAIDIARVEAAGLRVKAEAPEFYTQKVRWMAGAIQSDNIADYIEAAIAKGATT